MAKYDDEDGVWRTIGGRRIFIKDGEDIGSAMKRSGKFKSTKKKTDYEKKSKSEKEDLSNEDKETSNDIEKMVQKGNTYIPVRKGEDESDAIKRYENTNKPKEAGNKDIDRRAELMKYTQNNKEQIKKWVDEYDEKTNKEAFEKARQGKGLTKEEYFGFLGSEPKEGDIVDDKRVGKNGKLENIPRNEFKTLPNGDRYYVGKDGTDDTYERIMRDYQDEFKPKSSNNAYRKAFQEYKKEHPNTKLTLQKFIDISEGR